MKNGNLNRVPHIDNVLLRMIARKVPSPKNPRSKGLALSGSEKPKFGPGFQDARSRLYRSEYALITIVIVTLVIFEYIHSPNQVNLLELVFWAILPDLAAFIPIGLAARNGGAWPKWGASLYNLFHNIILWAAVFGTVWIFFGNPQWALLGWLGHITTDRAVGYGLRMTKESV